MHENAKRNSLLKLLPLVALLQACATPLPVSTNASPKVPPKPAATQQQPPLPYSASARLDMEKWQQRLTDTQATQPSVSQPGLSK